MATPRLNPALTRFRSEINARWPNRDRRSDGWIGDTRHQATKSDHNPDPDGSVDAIDIDVDGINVSEVLSAAVKHEATQYVIYNRRITSRSYHGGLGYWHPYTGESPHTEHIHVSTRDTHEKSTKPWFPITEDELSAEDVINYPLKDPTDGSTHRLGDYVRFMEYNVRQQIGEHVLPVLTDIKKQLEEIKAKLPQA